MWGTGNQGDDKLHLTWVCKGNLMGVAVMVIVGGIYSNSVLCRSE